MSLPYGLYCSVNNGKVNYDCVRQNNVDYALEFHDKLIVSYPILYPLSDLTKEIQHQGEKFIPIVELAKISGIKYNVVRKIGEHSIDLGKNNDDFSIRFWYESFTYNSFLACRNGHYFPINQLLLIQKLIEWHFDIALLIGKREAININMLHQNPYA